MSDPKTLPDRREPVKPEHQGVRWLCRPFAGLGVDALYAMLKLRQEVFVVEQRCAYLDADGLDPRCWHLLGWGPNDRLLACLRIVPPGLKSEESSLGRVATSQEVRGTGLGHDLLAKGVARCMQLYPASAVRISAQAHLEAFYARFGFVAEGDVYLEDDIPHVAMVRPVSRPVRRGDVTDMGGLSFR